MEASGDVPCILHMNEAQEMACKAIYAGDMNKLAVTYFCGSVARHLLLMAAVMLTRPV
jgi:hypothetical protein